MASCGFYGILETQESTSAAGGPIGIGVRNLISSLEITASGLKGIRFVSRKLIRIFSLLKVTKNVVWK